MLGRIDSNEKVALFTRAWIEMTEELYENGGLCVALFTRAWIEITLRLALNFADTVALFTRAWIEIGCENSW